MLLTKRQLNAALRKLTKLNAEAHLLDAMICDHCLVVYGVQPADVDNDEHIDGVAGASGCPGGMTADELERSMSVRDSISRKLCAGSDVVTVGDLRDAENALAGVKAFLAQLAHHNPILLRHPSIASTIR